MGLFSGFRQKFSQPAGSLAGRPDLKNLPAKDIERLAKRGDPHAQYLWGTLLFAADVKKFGFGSRSCDGVSHPWMERAAQAGVPEAQDQLAHRYRYGRGVPADTQVAERYYRLAADQGLTEAQVGLAALQYACSDDPAMKAAALVFLEDFITNPKTRFAQGGITAVMTLKRALLQRDCQDLWTPRVWDWLEDYARNGDIEACVIVGMHRLESESHGTNDQETADFLTTAAMAASGIAQCLLANLYWDGRGVPQNFMVAHAWFNVGATSVNPSIASSARDGREALAKVLTADQIIQAQNMALQFQTAIAQQAEATE